MLINCHLTYRFNGWTNLIYLIQNVNFVIRVTSLRSTSGEPRIAQVLIAPRAGPRKRAEVINTGVPTNLEPKSKKPALRELSCIFTCNP